jgi:hypothetical protein
MPQLVGCTSGYKLSWTAEEDALLHSAKAQGRLWKDVAKELGVGPRSVNRRAKSLGLTRANGQTVTRILREEFHVLEKLSKQPNYSRKVVEHTFNIKRNYVDILHDVIILIQARDAVRDNLGIEAKITPSGRLKRA